MSDTMLSKAHCLAEIETLEEQIKLESMLLAKSVKASAATAAQKLSNQLAARKSRLNYVRACLEAFTPTVITDPDQVWFEFMNDTIPKLAPARLEQLRRRIDEVIGAPLRLVHNADLAVQND